MFQGTHFVIHSLSGLEYCLRQMDRSGKRLPPGTFSENTSASLLMWCQVLKHACLRVFQCTNIWAFGMRGSGWWHRSSCAPDRHPQHNRCVVESICLTRVDRFDFLLRTFYFSSQLFLYFNVGLAPSDGQELEVIVEESLTVTEVSSLVVLSRCAGTQVIMPLLVISVP